MLPKSANSRLILWLSLALAVTSTVSAILCYAYFIGIDTLGSAMLSKSQIQYFKIAILLSYPLLILIMVLLFRRKLRLSLQPLKVLTQKCATINIHNLEARLSSMGNSEEANQFVTACNAMLDRLESGAKRMRQFSGDASHELRTPLTILRGETEVALRWGKTIDEFRAAMQSNMEEIDRMGRIIEDLLTLAKSESGELPLSIKQLSLSDLLQELYMQGSSLAEEKAVEVTLIHQADSELIIYGDDLRLRQMFLNLLTNAIKCTDSGGEITITAQRDNDNNNNNIIVSITDTGIGISPEHLPHIFERFYRTDKDRNRTSGGTGLGLAIVKWVIETHGGSIDVDSTPGVGTTFKVTLPVAGPPAQEFG